MKNLLIVTKSQYGYHVDPYKFGYYLKNDFRITHLSWDFGLPKIVVPGVRTKYLARKGNKLIRWYRFLKKINMEIGSGNYDLVFLVYFPGCTFLRWQNPQQTFNLDIRTATDTDKALINLVKDKFLRWEAVRFPHLSILSHGLANKLGFTKYHFLPLGGEKFCSGNKSFNHANLLYVGTLENRNLLVFIRGLYRYMSDNKLEKPPISLTIIGDGPGNERTEIEDYIQSHGLENVIRTTGYVHNDQLSGYFEEATIGISYVPITPYYTHQPPTKTYEYLLSGLPVLATATVENAKIITDISGELIQDDEASVARGLEKLIQRLNEFDSEKIRRVCNDYSWQYIARNNLAPYLESLPLSHRISYQVG